MPRAKQELVVREDEAGRAPSDEPTKTGHRTGRGRKATAQAADTPEPTLSAADTTPAAPKRSRKTQTETDTPSPPARRSRKAAAAQAEGTPEPVEPPQEPALAAAATPRRRRKTAAPEVLPPAPEATATDPVLLEVPKKRRARRPKAAEAAPDQATAAPELAPADQVEAVPLEEVLGGVEPVAVEDTSPAAEPAVLGADLPEADLPVAEATLVLTGDAQADTPEPLVDTPLVEELEPPLRDSRRNRKPKREARSEPASLGTQVPEDEEATQGDQNPARDLVIAQLRRLGRPIHVRDLERTFTRQMLDRLGDWRDLETLLDELTRSGEVVRTRRRTYGLPEAMNLVRGRFQASAAGFGFVIPDSGDEDFYVAPEATLEAWNGDTVLVRIEGRGGESGARRGQRGDGSPRASVVRIVERAYRQLVGTLEFSKGHPILRADDPRARHRILLLPEGLTGLESGARVVADLFWPEQTGEDEVFGQVTRVLGEQDDPATETEAVIVKYGLRGEFPQEVLAEAQAIPTQIPAEALVGRLDLRDFNIFTVDGRDAKDFDDAIHIQPTPQGTFVVGVHIADVSHYVREGSLLDKEAYARATSVYLPGRVLPMLPEHLSNGVCSLVPYEDRLTMTALVELSAEGDILDVKLTPSVIRSKARLTYDEVQAYSEATATLPDHARHLEGDLHLLLKITTKLRQKRLREGSLDFKLREVKVDVGPDGRMELIPIREETARGMIEDLMLLANKVVAHHLIEREIPTLFRIHEEPTLQKFQEASNAIGRLGLAFPGGEPTPQAYQAVLKAVRGTPREGVVNTLLLRSMQQAKYAGENLGHFGLAFDEYLHFTSPIRRYPDLLVHRVLKAVLSGDLTAGSRAVGELRSRLPAMGEHTSERERAAAEAERDLTKYYQAKWAQEHLGETFPGNVSGVVASGLFVTLENGVEGKLHISNLDDDYYVYLEDAQMLRGRSTGRTFRLGDPLTVTISQVNPLARQIDFTQEDTDMDGNTPRPRARRREEREAERRERLQAVSSTPPRKFTLEDPQPAGSSGPARPQGQGRGGRNPAGRDGGSQGNRSPLRQGGRTRRVITLERPRNEHLRPVNITVQRMYFGDWTVDNLPADEEQGGNRGGRSFDRRERDGRSPASSRGGNDRGAVRDLGGRAAAPAAQPASAAEGPGEADSRRRRRRRGRRSGSGGQG